MRYLIPLFLFTLIDQTIGSSSFIFQPPIQSSTKYHVYDLNLGTNNIPIAAEEWIVSGLTSSSQRTYQCGTYPLLGGLGITGINPSFTRVYTDLPSHTYINYLVSMFFIDHWETTDKIIFYIDGAKIFDFYPVDWVSQKTSNICGESEYDLNTAFIGQVAHTQDSISLQIEGQLSSTATSFGIYQVVLSCSNQVTTSPLKIIQCPGNNAQYTDAGTACAIRHYYNYANSACEACDTSCFFCWGPASNQCFACRLGYSFDGTACVLCSANCAICSTVGTCDRCKTNFVLNPGDQSCTSTCTDTSALLKGTTGIQYCVGPCLASEFMMWNYTCTSVCTLPLKVALQYSNLFCTFPCDADKYLYWNGTCSDSCDFPYVQFTFHDENFEPDSKYCNLPCKTNEYVFGDGSCSTTCPETMASTMIDSLVKYCYSPSLTPEEQKKIEALNSAKSTAGKTGKAALAALNLLLPSNPTSLISGSLQQTLEYLRYLNISRSQRLEAMFDGTTSSYELISIPAVMPKISRFFADNSLPYMFEKYEVESSFLVNCGDQILSLAATYALTLFSILFNWLCKFLRNRVFLQFLSFCFKTSLKNYFIGQLYESFGVLFFFTAIEIISYDSKSDFDIISLLAAIICIIVVFILLGRHYWIIQKYQRLKKTPEHLEKFKKKYQDSEILFEDFTDNSFTSQAFLFFCSLRNIFCNLIIGLLTSSPLAQIILINLTSFLMLSYLLIKRPVKDTIELIQQICFELIIFVANLSFFVNAITDKTAKDDTNIMKNTSEVIIVSNMIFAFLPLVFLLIRVFLGLVVSYKWLKLHLQKDKLKQKNILKSKINPRASEMKRKLKTDNSEILHLDRGNSSFLEDQTFQKKQVSRKHVKQPQRRISRKDILNGLESHLNDFGRLPETKTSLPPSHNSPTITRKGTLAESFSLKTLR